MMERCLAHLEEKERQAIRLFISQLGDLLSERLLCLVLFGSKARGDSGPWSDIDILVIGQERWDRMRRDRFRLYQNILVEGIPLPLPASA